MNYISKYIVGIFTFSFLLIPLSTSAEDTLQCELGRDAIEGGSYVHAITLLNSCIKEGQLTDLSKSKAFSYLANSLLRLKQNTIALDYIKKAIELNSNNAYAHMTKGVYLHESRKLYQAVNSYNKAIRLDPKLLKTYKERAKSYLHLMNRSRSKDKLKLALADINHVLSIAPEDSEAYRLYGTSMVAMRDYLAAIKSFNKAIELQPNNLVNYYVRGATKIDNNHFKSGLNDMNRVLKIKPGFSYARKYRAKAYIGLKRFVEAKKDLLFVRRINKNDSDVGRYLALIEKKLAGLDILSKHSKENAIPKLSKYVKDKDPYVEHIISQAKYYIDNNNVDDALKYLTNALSLGANKIVVYRLRGNARMKNEEYSKAVSDFTHVLTFDRRDTETFVSRGIAYLKLGQRYKALRDFDIALQIDPEHQIATNHKKSLIKKEGEHNKKNIVSTSKELKVSSIYSEKIEN